MKNGSKEELIIRKGTVRLIVKQELFVKRKKKGELDMYRTLERMIKDFSRKKHVS